VFSRRQSSVPERGSVAAATRSQSKPLLVADPRSVENGFASVLRQRILDCGGKRSATPLSHARKIIGSTTRHVRLSIL